MNEKGNYIIVEGGSGSGKTIQIDKLIKGSLNDYWLIREPGGTQFGEKIRSALLDLGQDFIDPNAEFLAFSAARANLIRGVVIPGLLVGKNYIADRSWFSSYAYQGARGIPKETILKISEFATDNLKPDLVIFYKIEAETGQRRKRGMADVDRIDLETLEFLNEVIKNYNELSVLFPTFWETIDTSGSIEEVYQETLGVLRRRKLIE